MIVRRRRANYDDDDYDDDGGGNEEGGVDIGGRSPPPPLLSSSMLRGCGPSHEFDVLHHRRRHDGNLVSLVSTSFAVFFSHFAFVLGEWGREHVGC